MQKVPPGVWTKLDDYDVDVRHWTDGDIDVWVEGAAVKNSADALLVVYPSGYYRTPGWRAPLDGTYQFVVPGIDLPGVRWRALKAGARPQF